MRKNKCSQKWSCLPYAFKTFSIETAPSLYKRVFYAVNMSQAFKEKSNEITTAIFVPKKPYIPVRQYVNIVRMHFMLLTQ